MDKLVRRRELRKEDLPKVEDPFFAEGRVKRALRGWECLHGKTEFLRDCGFTLGQVLSEPDLERAVKEIRDGRWLFLTNDPTRPMRLDDHFGAAQCFPMPAQSNRLAENEKGPGKWRTIDIDYDGLKNTFSMMQNRLGSLGDEGRIFGSEGKDYDNTSRVVTQQWVPLDSHEDHLVSRSVIHRYGELRAITQRYLEGEDKWQISGKSWHWQPVLPFETYEHREKNDARRTKSRGVGNAVLGRAGCPLSIALRRRKYSAWAFPGSYGPAEHAEHLERARLAHCGTYGDQPRYAGVDHFQRGAFAGRSKGGYLCWVSANTLAAAVRCSVVFGAVGMG